MLAATFMDPGAQPRMATQYGTISTTPYQYGAYQDGNRVPALAPISGAESIIANKDG